MFAYGRKRTPKGQGIRGRYRGWGATASDPKRTLRRAKQGVVARQLHCAQPGCVVVGYPPRPDPGTGRHRGHEPACGGPDRE